MHRALTLFSIPMLLAAADLTIDHVTIAGKDLKPMQARLAATGLEAQYGGPHNNHSTEMAVVSFPDGSYLELIAIAPNADPKAVAAHEWAAAMRDNAGPCAWAARAKDLETEIHRLQSAGVAVSPAARGGRRRPDGKMLEWETAQIGLDGRGTFFPFLIHDLTPRQDRAFVSGKASNRDFTGIRWVVIAVRSMKDAVKRYQQAYGVQPPLKQVDAGFGAHMGLLGGTPVVLAEPLHSQTWIAQRIEQFGEGPCAYILSAKNPKKYKPVAKTRWFGADISWFDPDALGWHLGFTGGE